MYIRKVSFQGIKAISDPIEFDFTPSNDSTFLSENIENFGIEKYGKDFRVLKQIAFIGLNSAGKSSALRGIQIGMALLANPFNTIHMLKQNKNLFWDKSFLWNFEFITSIKNKTILARKYFVTLEINKEGIHHELIEYSEVSKTGKPREKKVIYELKNKELNIDGKIYKHNLNNITFFSLVRTGQLVEELKFLSSVYKDLFFGLDWLNDEIQNFNFPSMSWDKIVIPKDEKYLEKMNIILRAFDPRIVDVKTNNLNELILKIKQNGITKEVHGMPSIQTVLSNGTFSFLKKNTLFLKAMISRSILFLDEMDASYHSGLFSLLIEILRKESKSQIIFTTHSPDVFNNFLRYDQINVIKTTENSVKVTRVSDLDGINDNNESIKKIKKIIKNNPNISNIMQELDELNE